MLEFNPETICRPFGGVNIIMGGDFFQLPPPEGGFLGSKTSHSQTHGRTAGSVFSGSLHKASPSCTNGSGARTAKWNGLLFFTRLLSSNVPSVLPPIALPRMFGGMKSTISFERALCPTPTTTTCTGCR